MQWVRLIVEYVASVRELSAVVVGRLAQGTGWPWDAYHSFLVALNFLSKALPTDVIEGNVDVLGLSTQQLVPDPPSSTAQSCGHAVVLPGGHESVQNLPLDIVEHNLGLHTAGPSVSYLICHKSPARSHRTRHSASNST